MTRNQDREIVSPDRSHHGDDENKKENKKMNTGINKDGTFQPQTTITRYNGTLDERYSCYLKNADDGKGGDITCGGKPLRTFEEWLNA